MRVGLIDCDRKNSKNIFPNLALMKLSAWHKKQGDAVEWYDPLFGGHFDKVYVSKVFSFSPNYEYYIDADVVEYGGGGFAIETVDGKEIYNKEKDKPLPYEIEHIYPDYSIYNITNTAYGFLSRGCPRGCSFCHVKQMQGTNARKVCDLSEFWDGQKNIVLLDPNITACREWRELLEQLINSGAWVDFSQGVDIRTLTDEKMKVLAKVKTKSVHFAWDRYEDKALVYPKLKHLAEVTGWNRRRIVVYVLVGDKERRITEQDLERINLLRPFAYPYVTIYNKHELPKGHELLSLQRWVNNRFVWEACETFEDYKRSK